MSDQILAAVFVFQLCVLFCANDDIAATLAGLGLALPPLSSIALNRSGYYLHSLGHDSVELNLIFFNDDWHMLVQLTIVTLLTAVAAKLEKPWLCVGYTVISLFIFASFHFLADASTIIFYAIGYTCEVLLILAVFKCGPGADIYTSPRDYDSHDGANRLDKFEGLA